MYLKKYFTEGLVQVAILLSLSGMRVDVDPHLPPLSEIILGQSSALTQTQFHNLRNSLEGQDLHPKSVDLDGFFTARRLLGWLRSLDRLQLPTTELEAWLVHREPDPLGSLPVQEGQLEGNGGLESTGDLPALRGIGEAVDGDGGDGEGEIPGLGFGQVVGDNQTVVGAASPITRQQSDGDIAVKEDSNVSEFLWSQEADPGQESEDAGFGNPRQQLEPLLSSIYNNDDEEEEEFRTAVWTSGGHNPPQIDPILGTSTQGYSDPELMGLDAEASFPTQRPLLSPLIPADLPLSFDLEQQWQDLLAIMEPQAMELAEMNLNLPVSNAQHSVATASMDALLHQDVSLHVASEDTVDGCPNLEDTHTQSTYQDASSGDSDSSLQFSPADIASLLLPETNGSSDLVDPALLMNFLENSSMTSPLRPMLEESMLDEISLMDLALEEGFNPSQINQLEEHLEDSDSGLSLNFSHSPASPSGSETSCSSSSSYSSSSSSSSSTESFFEEGAVGYDHGYDDMEDPEDASSNNVAETSKMCRTVYMDPARFQHLPWLDDISHDHTYHLPPSSGHSEAGQKGCFEHPSDVLVKDNFISRDERRARALGIPFSNDHIINLPVEEFNKLLTRHKLSAAQLTLVRDIRRRGKNKMAAQNCRQRKLDVVHGLQHNIEGLKRHRARLVREKAEMSRSLREMKQRLTSLYQEIFTQLRDHENQPLSDREYSLEFNADGRVVLTNAQSRRKAGKKQDKRN